MADKKVNAFNKAAIENQNAAVAFENAKVQKLLKLLEAGRKRVHAKMGTVPPASRLHLEAMLKEIDKEIAKAAIALEDGAMDAWAGAYAKGGKAAAGELGIMEPNLTIIIPAVPIDVVERLNEKQLDHLKGLTKQQREAVRREIQIGVITGAPWEQIIKAVADPAKGKWKLPYASAMRTVRQGIGEAHNAARVETIKRGADKVPGLGRAWLSRLVDSTPICLELHGQKQPADKPFNWRNGKWTGMQPWAVWQDAEPKYHICHSVVVPWAPHWPENPKLQPLTKAQVQAGLQGKKIPGKPLPGASVKAPKVTPKPLPKPAPKKVPLSAAEKAQVEAFADAWMAKADTMAVGGNKAKAKQKAKKALALLQTGKNPARALELGPLPKGYTPKPKAAAAAPAPKAPVKPAKAPKAAPTPKPSKLVEKPAQAPAQPAPMKLSELTQVGTQGGSNLGGRFVDKNGQEWYIKAPLTDDHAHNEALAAKLYELAGVKGPEVQLIELDGTIAGQPVKGLGVASKWQTGLQKDAIALKAGKIEGAFEGFGVDSWVANWDSVGLEFDNLVKGTDGKARRIDVGGSLLYRAQGGPKGALFGNKVTELDTLRDSAINPQAAQVFGKMTDADMAIALRRVAELPDEAIRKTILESGLGTPQARKELAEKMLARKQDIVHRLAVLEDKLAKAKPPAPAPKPVKLPKPKPTPEEKAAVAAAKKAKAEQDKLDKAAKKEQEKLAKKAALQAEKDKLKQEKLAKAAADKVKKQQEKEAKALAAKAAQAQAKATQAAADKAAQDAWVKLSNMKVTNQAAGISHGGESFWDPINQVWHKTKDFDPNWVKHQPPTLTYGFTKKLVEWGDAQKAKGIPVIPQGGPNNWPAKAAPSYAAPKPVAKPKGPKFKSPAQTVGLDESAITLKQITKPKKAPLAWSSKPLADYLDRVEYLKHDIYKLEAEFRDIFAGLGNHEKVRNNVQTWTSTYSYNSQQVKMREWWGRLMAGEKSKKESLPFGGFTYTEETLRDMYASRRKRWERLRDKTGIPFPEHFHLYRGVRNENPNDHFYVQAVAQAWKEGGDDEHMNIPMRQLASWSVNRRSAEKFTAGYSSTAVFEAIVPFENTLADQMVDDGSFMKTFWGEHEVIVGTPKENQMIVKRKSTVVTFKGTTYTWSTRQKLIDALEAAGLGV